MLFYLLFLSIQSSALENTSTDQISLEACDRHKANDGELDAAMNEGVDADCQKAIEDGRQSCFADRVMNDRDRLMLKADGDGAAGSNRAAIIESKRNSLLQEKMDLTRLRCVEAITSVREVCRSANENFKQALKDKDLAFKSDLAQRQTVTSYAYQAAAKLLMDAAICTQSQAQIYKEAAEKDQTSANASTSQPPQTPGNGREPSAQPSRQSTSSQREVQAITQVTAETAITQGGRMIADVAQNSAVKIGARTVSQAVTSVSVVTADKDDVTGPVVTTITAAAEGFGASVKPTLFGGIFGTIFLHTSPAGVRCDGVFDPVEAQAKQCPPDTRFGAQSIESAARIMEQRP